MNHDDAESMILEYLEMHKKVAKSLQKSLTISDQMTHNELKEIFMQRVINHLIAKIKFDR